MRERVAIIAALLLAGILATAILCPAGGPGAAVWQWTRGVIAHAISGALTPPSVDPWKPPGDPGEHVAVTGSGHGIWTPSAPVTAGDSIPVSVVLDIGPGPDTATVNIGSDCVQIGLDLEIEGPIYPFRVWGEAAFDGPSVMWGGGAAWEPLHLWGASAGPGLCVGREWVAPVFRVSRPVWSTIDAGIEGGWRFQRGPDEIHVGISVGVCL